MWYVMQVGTGMEERLSRFCEGELCRRSAGHSFLLRYETQRKLRGQWQTVQKILFPGMIFFEAGDADALAAVLREILGLAESPAIGTQITPLSAREVRLLEEVGGKEHVMRMSVGAIEGSDLKILSGPLQSMDCSRIARIDRHKRRATMTMDLCGGERRVQVGLEVRTKTA
ncbi:MAG: transcription antiterminator [Clostridiales bacterium]|nr:transcription antiterminator [Clostridiales bacterium]